MDGLRARLHAAEGRFAREANAAATRKHLDKLVAAGALPAPAASLEAAAPGAMASVGDFSVPTVFRERHHAEKVFQHTPSPFPVSRAALIDSWAQLGTKVSFGRARWTIDDASIFSVADGKRLAQEPQKVATVYETKRLSRVAQAAAESPLVQGYRLLPQFTPGRAFLWGTILAVWGTGAIVMSSARVLDIKSVDTAGERLRDILRPYGNAIYSTVVPVKERLASNNVAGDTSAPSALSELAKQLKTKLAGR